MACQETECPRGFDAEVRIRQFSLASQGGERGDESALEPLGVKEAGAIP
jgi:hypothetical protein